MPSSDQTNMSLYVTVNQNNNEYQRGEKDYTSARGNINVKTDINATQPAEGSYPRR